MKPIKIFLKALSKFTGEEYVHRTTELLTKFGAIKTFCMTIWKHTNDKNIRLSDVKKSFDMSEKQEYEVQWELTEDTIINLLMYLKNEVSLT